MSRSNRSIAGTSRLGRVIRYAREEGWTISRTRNNHLRFSKQGCAPVFTGSTPSDTRACLNTIKHLKHSERHGRVIRGEQS
ncbi:hypothetical protein LMG33810_002691 [Carnimonas sp. LMG 33810]|uniref:type II toxin-antitoxin system HicA family toxin n=1 Tax=Carnimonas bestiolae TaxID=3402172 RepID=UPI003EDBA961